MFYWFIVDCSKIGATHFISCIHQNIFMRSCKMSCFSSCAKIPNQFGKQIFLSKDSIHEKPKINDLFIIDTNKNNPVVIQKLPRHEEPRIHHREPSRVEAAGGFGVAGKKVSLGVLLAGELEVGIQRVGEVVGIDEVLAGVVGRVDVYHLHPPGVGLLEELQDLEVLALDEDVAGVVEIDGLLRRGYEGGPARNLKKPYRVPLPRPVEGVPLWPLVGLVAQELSQAGEVHLSFLDNTRKKALYPLYFSPSTTT